MRVERARFVDEYAEAGERAVMLEDGRVVALSELASTVLELLADEPLELNDLAIGLVQRYGPPPGDVEAVSTTRAVVSELSEAGLVEVLDG